MRTENGLRSHFEQIHGRLVLVASVLLFSGISSLRADPIQWTIQDGGNGAYFDLVMPDSYLQSYSWTAADSTTSSLIYKGLQGHLATVVSASESDFLRANFASQLFDNGPLNVGIGPTNSKYAWIGLYAPTPYSSFQWISGEPVQYTDWAPSEPNYFGTPGWQYVHYWTRDFGGGPTWTWNNEQDAGFGVEQNHNTYGFFVEYGGLSAVPEPSSRIIVLLACLAATPWIVRCTDLKGRRT
jgi:hypothetical protein